MNTRNLHLAKKNKNDEFFTRLPDIENELKHYEKHFAGKVVYCNCDNPAWSNFPKFFTDNFGRLQLKGLLTNHLEADGKGDFRGKEALAKLEQADIVCTNPPFSLFREYIAQLMGATPAPLLDNIGKPSDKKFLVIGNLNAMGCKEIFPLLKAGKLWTGTDRVRAFNKPCGELKVLGSTIWFTNLDHAERHKDILLTRQYDPAIHHKYDNHDAINVDKIADIPRDWNGYMGVPITFLLSYNPMQFDIIKLRYGDDGKDLRVNGKDKFYRVIIRRKP